jgi:hypothetical protein
MPEYILFMHDDVVDDDPDAWAAYLAKLKGMGVFEGGSEIGVGSCFRKRGPPPQITSHLAGYIRVNVPATEDVGRLLIDNPHYEAGGTVEIRELPRS